MRTHGTAKTGTTYIFGTNCHWKTQMTLEGLFVTINDDKNGNVIWAMVKSGWFTTNVTLLRADSLNYDWAKEEILKIVKLSES